MIDKLILCDFNGRLSNSWEKYFNHEKVDIVKGSIFEQGADTIVAPGNSFAYMDGGLDREICKYFGQLIEAKVRKGIRDATGQGLLPVGEAILVETDDQRIPNMIYAPTMRLPRNIRGTDNVYKAMSATIKCIKENYNKLNKIAMSGLGTGVGEMFPDVAAEQMWNAFKEEWQ